MTRPEPSPARLFVEALRLDRHPLLDVRARAARALDLGVAGFLFFGGDATWIAGFTRELRARAGRPLWFAADLERGAGQQFSGATVLPPPAALARLPDPEDAVRAAAELTAREARELGINWVLAPVLDLDVEPRNPIVGSRSFGADPELVARLGRIWVETVQGAGVAACAKHFPGHGRTRADSHVELPRVTVNREELESDLRPFREVAGEVVGVMTAHVAYPCLGSEEPATLSPAILCDLLRKELGFRGLVVSDALMMAGFEEETPGTQRAGPGSAVGDRMCRALEAGCDLLLYPRDLERAVAWVGEVLQKRDADVLLSEAIERSDRACRAFDVGDRSPGAFPGPDPAGAEWAERSLVAIGSPVDRGLAPGRVTEVVAVDGPARTGRGPFGQTFVKELEALGWSLGQGGDDVAQQVFLFDAAPCAWRGTGDRGGTEAAKRASASGAWPVVFGHVRHLAEVGGRGLCAWWPDPAMERAAARWLDRVLAGGAI